MPSIPLWIAVFSLPNAWADYLLPPLFLFLILAAFRGTLLRRFFSTPWVAAIGGMCYSVYLTHSLTLQAAAAIPRRLMLHAGFWDFFIASSLFVTPCLLSVGTIFFIFIERPCMDKRWPTKLWARLHGYSSRQQVGDAV